MTPVGGGPTWGFRLLTKVLIEATLPLAWEQLLGPMGCLAVKPQSRSGSWWYDSAVRCDETKLGCFRILAALRPCHLEPA